MALERIRQRRHAIALAAIVLLGLSLRLYQIGAKSLWNDETFSVWLSRQSIASIQHYVATEHDHPPLYYLLLHLWLRFTGSEAGIRLFSALCGILNIPVMYLLGRRIAGKQLGLLAALILAASPFHVWYGQEARMYALLTLAVSLSLYFLALLLSDPGAVNASMGCGLAQWWRSAWLASGRRDSATEPVGRASRAKTRKPGEATSVEPLSPPGARLATDLAWLGFVLSTAVAVLVHNTAVLLLAGVNVYVFGEYLISHIARRKAAVAVEDPGSGRTAPVLRGRFLGNWLLAQVGVLLLLGPWLPTFLAQFRRADVSWVGPPTLQTVYHAWRDLSSICAPQAWPYNLAIAFLFPTLLVLGIAYFRRQSRWLLFLLVLAATPFIGELLASLRSPVFLTRTLIWASIPYYLLLAAGLLQLRRRALIVAGLGVLLAINALSLRAYYEGYPKEQWREATAYVCERAGEQDFIILSARYAHTALDYYLPYCRKPLEYKAMNAKKKTLDALPDLIAGRPRIWLVYGHEWSGDPQELFAKALGEQMRLVHEEHFYCLRVLEYER